MSRSDQVLCDPSEKNLKKVCPAKDEDFFSNLPESLIRCILSCLPTKDAVRTSVLSKDWEYRWTTIYNFDILDYHSSPEQMETLGKFVDRVLLQAQDVKCFKLMFMTKYTSRHASWSWIHAALRHKIEILHLLNLMQLNEDGKERDDDDDVCFLNNISLRELCLSYLPFQVSAEICLPNLTSLNFTGVRILNESSNTNHLKYTFPFLETLTLDSCKWLKVKIVEINAPELTTFVSAEGEDGYSIKVTADKLKKFESDCSLPDEAIVTGSRVVDATFEYMGPNPIDDDGQFFRKKGLQVLKLLKGFSSLMKLELSKSMIEVLGEWRQQFPFPRLAKLAELNLEVPVFIELLLELLHAMPYLKLMSIFVIKKECLNNDNYDEVESVPSCVVSHLEEVLFTYHEVEDTQYHLAKFFLKNGSKLKKFHADAILSNLTGDEILEKLSAFPRVSTSVTISTQ